VGVLAAPYHTAAADRLYGMLFLASGAGLLTIINVLARSWPWPALVVSPDGGGSGRVQSAPPRSRPRRELRPQAPNRRTPSNSPACPFIETADGSFQPMSEIKADQRQQFAELAGNHSVDYKVIQWTQREYQLPVPSRSR
jgi:hypothetical protein